MGSPGVWHWLNAPLVAYLEIGMIGGFLILEIIVVIAMYRKRHYFPTLFLYQ